MAFLSPVYSLPSLSRPGISPFICMSSDRVRVARDKFLNAANGLELGRKIAGQPARLEEMDNMLKTLEREWKDGNPTEISLSGKRKLVYTNTPDILAMDKPSWFRCEVVHHMIDPEENSGRIRQIYKVFGDVKFVIDFKFELGFMQTMRRKVTFVQVKLGPLPAFDVRKNGLVGSFLVLYKDEDYLFLKGNKDGITVLKILNKDEQ